MDNNWKTATKANRAALYQVARAITDTTNLSVEAIMEQAFGHKLMVGTDYLSNFRSPSKTILIFSSDEYCLRVARLISLTIFSDDLRPVLVVCLMFHSSVVNDEPETLSYQMALFGPISADVRQSAHHFLPRVPSN